MKLNSALARANALIEGYLRKLFLRDLDRLLCLADVGPNDHVYLPTAHAREAYAIRQLIQEVGEEQSPTFHLELRHPVATLDELAGKSERTLVERDSAVLRLVYSYEAIWKATQKVFAALENVRAASPNASIRAARGRGHAPDGRSAVRRHGA